MAADHILRLKIIESLKNQGFLVNGRVDPASLCKEEFRNLHYYARNEQISIHKKFLTSEFNTVLQFAVDGKNIDPNKIELELIEVKEGTIEEKIFRWWNLAWWSIPYQKAYGRQMRFLLWDKKHHAPFGLIGLQSPILKMVVRDKYLRIPKESLDYWVNRSLQAQRLGALPPYNQLIGGKMVSLALTSNEIRDSYKHKYVSYKTLLKERTIDSDLLFLTTTSAFGRSSIYNRLSYYKEKVAISLGYTKGAGTFHIPQHLYREIQLFLIENGIDVGTTFGNGPSRKLKLLDTAFSLLKLGGDYTYHHIPREYFLFPLVTNLREIIETNDDPKYYDRPIEDLLNYWKMRWCLPRIQNLKEWNNFDGHSFITKLKDQILDEDTK